MAEKPIATAILDEARGAHGASRRILEIMEVPADDPIEVIMGLLRGIYANQQAMMTRLEIIERRLASKE